MPVGPSVWPGRGPFPQSRFPLSKPGDSKIWTLSGTLVDLNSNPIANSNVYVFRMDLITLVGQTITDGGGNWSIIVPTNGVSYLAVSYRGAPYGAEIAGVSAGTISPT